MFGMVSGSRVISGSGTFRELYIAFAKLCCSFVVNKQANNLFNPTLYYKSFSHTQLEDKVLINASIAASHFYKNVYMIDVVVIEGEHQFFLHFCWVLLLNQKIEN